jgi:UDP-N-acetylglucosamine--N-acetylmuramyl-(pentapeptide) pyrophosphoryl-undecaprenol N-acetylglucosamine transferase
LVNKPVILVPSPNVSEDHQTKNAMALVKKNAAVHVKDVDAKSKLINSAIDLLNDKNQQNELSQNIATLGIPDAADLIVDEIFKLLNLQEFTKSQASVSQYVL